MKAKNLMVVGATPILAAGGCLFLKSDFDGDNLTVKAREGITKTPPNKRAETKSPIAEPLGFYARL